jgi:predicted MFS family arabinose efflux permease
VTQNQQEISNGEEKHSGYRWILIVLLVASQQLVSLLIGGIGMLLPAIREGLSFGVGQSGVLGSLGSVASTFLSIPASMILVRFNPKRVFLVALVLAALTGFLCGRATAFVFLAISFCLLGVSTVLMQSPDTLLKVQWIPRREYAKMVGITMGMMAMVTCSGRKRIGIT